MGFAVQAIAVVVATMLGVFGARRALFLVASLLRRRPLDPVCDQLPTLLVVVPARNEAAGLGRTLEALDRMDYPRDRLQIALVDDHSDDATGQRMAEFAATRSHVHALRPSTAFGKGQALNAAITACPRTDLVGVCDADLGPRADCFRLVASAFADPTVGAATAYLHPANADVSASSRYAAVETWVQQLVTSAAKDRLGLNPRMLGGGAVYRRTALDHIGGFTESVVGEDLRASVWMTRAGYRTRFVVEAVAENLVPSRLGEYWRQHVRWARVLLDWGERPKRDRRMPMRHRAEELVEATGYLDRLALLTAIVLAVVGAMPAWLPAAYLAMVGLEVAVAVVRGGAGRRSPLFLLALLVCFPLDLAGAVAAVVAGVARRPFAWQTPRHRTEQG